jgi:hypothetical protein
VVKIGENMKYIITLTAIMLSFSSCTYKSFTDTVEGVYTDEVVVKPTSGNYKTLANTSKNPIIKESVVVKSPDELAKEQTTRFKKVGRITSSSFDPDVNLYIYNFSSDGDDESSIFFYDKKLPYSTSDLVLIDVKDNFLMNIESKGKAGSKKGLTLSQKKKKFKQKKRNYKIREAIEEKINTF